MDSYKPLSRAQKYASRRTVKVPKSATEAYERERAAMEAAVAMKELGMSSAPDPERAQTGQEPK